MLSEQPPRMITVILYALPGVFLWWLAGFKLDSPTNVLPGLVASVLLIAAAFCAMDWFTWKASKRVDQYHQSKARTPQVLIIEQINRMTPEQIKFVENNISVISIVPGTPEPLRYLRLGRDVEIPSTFIEQFVILGSDVDLCPVGSWNEGTKYRQYAQLLTNHLILAGFARPAAGNRPAGWVDKEAAMRWMGMGE
jgi:hypothetical protein